jgi:hypothetical protein
VRVKKTQKKTIVYDANDVIRSGNVPSSLGLCVDEPDDRWMEYDGAQRPSDSLNNISRYRIDDMYEAIDY